jgi:phosphoribosyl 1,2-cyclic phosphodiesterase
MIRIVLGGVRGTAPVAQAGFMRYGGATTSVLIEDGAGVRLVIDAGTGLRTLQPRLAVARAATPVLMLFTHYHLDHLIGLPAFAPLYDPGWHVTFASPRREGVAVEDALTRLVDKPFWPAAFRAQRRFLVLPDAPGEDAVRHGALVVRWCPVHHRNGCHAYRIDDRDSGASVVFATDLEWRASDAAEREALLRLCRTPRPAEVLIMDGQYDASEADRFSGWGHSTWQDAVQVAASACVDRLVVTHHAPDRDDAALDGRRAALAATGMNACLAREGMEIEIGEKL